MTIFGTAGNDPNIQGTAGNDVIDLLAGNDTGRGLGGNDSVIGGDGNDSLIGDDGADTLDGGSGNDTQFAGNGNDLLISGAGFLDFLIGDAGVDTLDGTGGSLSTAQYSTSPAGIVVNAAAGTVQDGFGSTDTLIAVDRVTGSPFADSMVGGDTLAALIQFTGRDGNDTLVGGGFNLSSSGLVLARYDDKAAGALIDLEAGTAQIGAEVDTLVNIRRVFGTPFTDTILGSSGNDVIRPLTGNDSIDGREGDDLVDYSFLASGVTVTSGSPDVPPGAQAFAPLPPVIVAFEDGDIDIFQLLNATEGLDGTGFPDLVRLFVPEDDHDDSFFNLRGGADTLEIFGGSFDRVLAGEGDDSVSTDEGDDSIEGEGGDDSIEAGGGDDSIGDGTGDDSVNAGTGNDTVKGGGGNDSMNGGTGFDEADLREITEPLGFSFNDQSGAVLAMSGDGGQTLNARFTGFEEFYVNDANFELGNLTFGVTIRAVGNITGFLGAGGATIEATGTGNVDVDIGGGFNVIDTSDVDSPTDWVFERDSETLRATGVADNGIAYGISVESVESGDGLRIVGTAFEESFAGEEGAPVGELADVLNRIRSGLLPGVVGGGGDDSYSGDMQVEYREESGAVLFTPRIQGFQVATAFTGTDALDNVPTVWLPPVSGNVVDTGTVVVHIGAGGLGSSYTFNSECLLDYSRANTDVWARLDIGQTMGFGGTDTLNGVNHLIGSPFGDWIRGNAFGNFLNGGDGDDGIIGGDGDDTLVPGGGVDTLVGGNGFDVVSFFEGQVFRVGLWGGVGGRDNRLAFAHSIDSSDFRNLLHIARAEDVEGAELGTVVALLTDLVRPEALIDQTTNADGASQTGTGNDEVNGGAGADTISDADGNNNVDGGGGDDFVGMAPRTTFSFAPPPSPVGAAPPGLVDELSPGDDLISGGDGADTVFSGYGDDIVDGGNDRDFLVGEDGNDSMAGADADDVLFGLAGDDFLIGEDGNDFLFSGAGEDVMDGGAGNDRLHVGADDLAAFAAGGIFDVLVPQDNAGGVTQIDLGAANQNVGPSGPQLSGFEAVDASIATAGVSVTGTTFSVDFGSGPVTVGNVLFGSLFSDTLTGSAAADIILGNAGADIITTGNGNDTITADSGNDTITAGSGADNIGYLAGAVVITDFETAGDVLQFFATAAITTAAQARAALQQAGNDAVLPFGGGNSVTFVGVSATTFSDANFIVF